MTTLPRARPVSRYSTASTADVSPSKVRSITGRTRPSSTIRASFVRASVSGWTGVEKSRGAAGLTNL